MSVLKCISLITFKCNDEFQNVDDILCSALELGPFAKTKSQIEVDTLTQSTNP